MASEQQALEACLRIVLAPVGTRGDIQPLVALGGGLRARGHEVVLIAPPSWEAAARVREMDFVGCGDELHQILDIGSGASLRLVRELVLRNGLQFEALHGVCTGADAIVGSMLQLAAPSVAELLRVPYFYSVFAPVMLPSSTHVPMSMPFARVPKWVSRLFYGQWPLVWNLLFRRRLNRGRAGLGLAPRKNVYRELVQSGHRLLAFDPALAPVPPDLDGPFTVTGCWRDAGRKALDPALDRFLQAGSPPVYVGFGSMKVRRPGAMRELLLTVSKETGRRLILSGKLANGPGADLPETCFGVDSVEHSALFPRVCAVVHHGGAGTTAAAAHAGVPQILVPHFGDQFFWGHRVRAHGLGAKPIQRSVLSHRRLSTAIRCVISDGPMRERCRAMSETLRGEDGIAKAVELLERLAEHSHGETREA